MKAWVGVRFWWRHSPLPVGLLRCAGEEPVVCTLPNIWRKKEILPEREFLSEDLMKFMEVGWKRGQQWGTTLED